MKIYIQNHCWAGVLVAIADTEEEAREIMKDEYTYSPKQKLEIKEIQKGMVVANYGDA
jgi:hypothetical protein